MEIDEAKQIKERMTILQAALGGLSAVTMPTSSAVTPTVRTPNVKRERVKEEGGDDTVASKGHSAKRSKPVYVELDD